MQALATNLLKPDQTLTHTKYFTARVSSPADKVKRQSTYLDALQSLSSLSILYGRYQLNPFTCRNCSHVHQIPNEKMTDVNIAVELMQDAFQDRFDTAFLVSADSDLVGPVVAVQRLFPKKRIVVACPPGRFSANLCNAAGAHFQIGRAVIAKSLFPETIHNAIRICPHPADIMAVTDLLVLEHMGPRLKSLAPSAPYPLMLS